MPEKIIEKLKNNIPQQWKICFIFALVTGLVAHIYKITNWLPNWDSLVFRYDSQNMVGMGRWFLPVVCSITSFYDLPWLTGLMAIIFHGLGAVGICKMFEVRKNITAAIIGAFIVSFPTVTSVMLYNYVADGYALAFLLSVIAAMSLTKEKPCYIRAIITIALSVGIYQAYITVTVMLLLAHLLLLAIDKETDLRGLILKTIRFFLTGVAGMLLYYLVFNLILKITGIEVIEYQGMSDAVTFSAIDIYGSLYRVRQSFETYFFDFSKGINVFNVLNCIVFVLTVLMYLSETVKNKLKISKLVFAAVYVVLMPVGASVLAFINSSIDYHNLMKMGFCVFYLFFILQYEKDGFRSERLNTAKMWTVLVVSFVIVLNYITIANICYHKLEIAAEKSFGTLVRIADRIEQTEGANECNRVMVCGALKGSEPYSADLPPDMTGTTDGYILRADDEIVGQSVLCSALNDYCGKNYEFVAGEEKQVLLKKAEDMDYWPQKNSVAVIDDVIVIKLGDEEGSL